MWQQRPQWAQRRLHGAVANRLSSSEKASLPFANCRPHWHRVQLWPIDKRSHSFSLRNGKHILIPDLLSVVVPTLPWEHWYVTEIGNHSNQSVRWGCPPFQRSSNPPEDYSGPGKLLFLHRKIIFKVAASENIPKKHNGLCKTQPSSSPPCPTSTNWWPVCQGLRLKRHNGITHLESSQKYCTRQLLLMDVCLFTLGLQLKKKDYKFFTFHLN